MVKNIKRYRKDLEKEGSPLAEKDDTGRFIHFGKSTVIILLPCPFLGVLIRQFHRRSGLATLPSVGAVP